MNEEEHAAEYVKTVHGPNTEVLYMDTADFERLTYSSVDQLVMFKRDWQGIVAIRVLKVVA